MRPRRPTPLSALARGKASLGEDALTAMVLGVLVWDPPSLVAWLSAVIDFGPGTPRPCPLCPVDIEAVYADLWPWWTSDRGVAGAEPDAELAVRHAGSWTLWALEAKLDAGKSEVVSAEDQLMRQHAHGDARARALATAWGEPVQFGGVLYVTRHTSPPLDDLTGSRAAIAEHGEVRLYWTSWIRAWTVLNRLARTTRDPRLGAEAADAVRVMRRHGLAGFDHWTGAPVGPPALPFGARLRGLRSIPRLAFGPRLRQPEPVPRLPFGSRLRAVRPAPPGLTPPPLPSPESP